MPSYWWLTSGAGGGGGAGGSECCNTERLQCEKAVSRSSRRENGFNEVNNLRTGFSWRVGSLGLNGGPVSPREVDDGWFLLHWMHHGFCMDAEACRACMEQFGDDWPVDLSSALWRANLIWRTRLCKSYKPDFPVTSCCSCWFCYQLWSVSSLLYRVNYKQKLIFSPKLTVMAGFLGQCHPV